MFTIPYLHLISDLEGLETHSFSWQLRLKELVGSQCAGGQVLCAAPGWDADHVSLLLAGWLLRGGLVLAHLTWLLLPHFICLFCLMFLFHLHTASCFSVSLSLVVTSYHQTTLTKDKKRGRQREIVPSRRPIYNLYESGGSYQLLGPIVVPKIGYKSRLSMLKHD